MKKEARVGDPNFALHRTSLEKKQVQNDSNREKKAAEQWLLNMGIELRMWNIFPAQIQRNKES